MKKTQTASIGGVVFQLEEDAHQKLSEYLAGIATSIADSEGHKEIMNDIESRIAEILLPKIKDFKQVVTIDDVDDVIGIMGKPNEFGSGARQTQSPQDQREYVRKRIFRDPDDKVLFGVCSGLGHYFGIDPFWIRLGWALSVFVFGFGILLYLILAVIMPKAVTAGEKLEMMGETVDVNNIRRRVEEELEYLKKKVNNLKDDLQNKHGQQGANLGRRFKDLFVSLGSGAGNSVNSVFRSLFVFVGFLLVFICSIILIALLITLFSGVNVIHIHAGNGRWLDYSAQKLFSLFALSGAARSMILAGIILFICVPLVGIIIRIGRAVLGIYKRSRAVTIVLGILWVVSWALIIGGSVSMFGHFSVTGRTVDMINFSNPSKTLYISMPQTDEEELSVRIDSLNFYITDDNIFRGNPSFCVEISPDTLYHLTIIKYGRGITLAEAQKAAKSIDYNFAQHDSVLKLDSYFELEQGSPWRKQKMELVLQAPVNKSILLPEGIDNIMCGTVHRAQRHTGGRKWTMGANGELNSAD